MSETINTIIYNDNIQSLTSNNINLYTNKLNGQITLGNTNVPVSMNNVSLNTLSVTTIDNINTINVSFLNVNNLICNQPNETKLYFNSNNTLTDSIPSSTTATIISSFSGSTLLSYDFTINGSILKNFKNYIIKSNIYCTISPDISCQVVYYYDIMVTGASTYLLRSVESDDINDLTTVDPILYTISMFTDTVLDNIIDGQSYTIRVYFKISSQSSRNLTMYLNSSFPSYISFISNYNVGYNANLTNNYLFSNPTTTSNPSLSTSASNNTLTFASNFVGTDVVFGTAMYLCKGIWNIDMYTTILTSVVNAYIYLMLSYKKSDNASIVYDTINYYGYLPTSGTEFSLKLTCTLVITTSNTYVIPYLSLLTGCTTPLAFKNVNTATGQLISTASGYNITRIA
jgi:hypothetical protein